MAPKWTTCWLISQSPIEAEKSLSCLLIPEQQAVSLFSNMYWWGKQFWFSGAAFIWGGRMTACHGLPSCLLHGSLLLCCCQFAALPVRCLASTSLSLSPARQPVLVLQPTPVPWQSGSTALCQCPDSSRVAFKPALMLHLSPLPLPVRCPYLGGTEERLIEQQAACLRAVTDHQQRQVRAADQVIHHPDRGCRRPPHHLLQ